MATENLTTAMINDLKKHADVDDLEIINDGKIGGSLVHIVSMTVDRNERVSAIIMETNIDDENIGFHSLEVYPMLGRNLKVDEIVQGLVE